MTRPKHKQLDIVALMRRGNKHTAKDLADLCGYCDSFVMDTLTGLQERGLIEFAGWAKREDCGERGQLPATWRWI